MARPRTSAGSSNAGVLIETATMLTFDAVATVSSRSAMRVCSSVGTIGGVMIGTATRWSFALTSSS
jgi:hypothetical protein